MAHLHALPTGHEFEGYRIERVLGAGGFGITYAATETMIGRTVAIKEFLPSSVAARATDGFAVHPLVAGDAEIFRWGLKRFRNEARTLVSFHHPHIVQVFRYFEANGTAYLVMALEKGASLAAVLKTQRTLPEAEIRAIIDPLLDGVAQVHAAGFLHRDIKPANIIIRENGAPVLIDFGAARQALGAKSQSAHAIVSPGYAPFEQYTNSTEQGPWTDIYALGATLYCCVTGTRPIEATDRVGGAPMRTADEIAGGHYSPALLQAIDHALGIQPEDRPQNVAEWRAELAAKPAPVSDSTLTPAVHDSATAATVAPTAARPTRRRAMQFGLGAVTVALVAGGGYELVRAQEEAERAERERQRVEAARGRAEAAAVKARDAQRRAQAEGRLALAAKQQALAAAECARRAAQQARNGASGYYTGQLTDGTQYEGQLNAQKLIDGCGIKTMADKRRFEGHMSAGKVHGSVVFTNPDGRRFEGAYVQNDVSGYGVHRYPQGHELHGKFVGLNVDGAAVWIETNGTRYEGEFRSSRWWGFGVIRETNGNIYEGEFIDGMRHGLGVQTTPAGVKTFGRWEKGVYKGVE